jgi:hypothetical protein
MSSFLGATSPPPRYLPRDPAKWPHLGPFDWVKKNESSVAVEYQFPSSGEVGPAEDSKSVTRPFLLCPPLIRHYICALYPTWGLSLLT